MNVLLCSVGRRPYLVEWFKRATGSADQVLIADADERSPARSIADGFILAPRVTDKHYEPWLRKTLRERNVGLAVSVNDFELSRWASMPKDEELDVLIRLDAVVQETVEDKLRMAEKLRSTGVSAPDTWLISDVVEGRVSLAPDAQYVVKGRYGSASRGLCFTTSMTLLSDVERSAQEVTDRLGRPVESLDDAMDLLVIQPRILGDEYGVDVVCNFDDEYRTVLARRKLAMRAGETDRAESVSRDLFVETGMLVAEAVPHPGLIDTDVIVDGDGTQWVIDVNPRFGGGYPFSQLAGADVPAAYVDWANGRSESSTCLDYRDGVIAGKYVGVMEIH